MSNTIAFQINDANFAELRKIAATEGLTPEQFVEQQVLRTIHAPRGQSFEQAMEEVLHEDRELLRRLAQ